MRLIDGDYLYNRLVANKCPDSLVLQMVKDEPTVNAVVIPDNATNGDAIKVLFPKAEVFNEDSTCITIKSFYIDEKECDKRVEYIDFSDTWWNALYRKDE